MLTVLAISLIPAVVAVGLWALTGLESFVLTAVVLAIVFPASLAKPGGFNIDAADILLLVALGSWVINNGLRNAPDPFIRGNAMFAPAVVFIGVNVASLLWSQDKTKTAGFSLQLIELLILYPVLLATLPRSVGRILTSMYAFIAATVVLSLFTLTVGHGAGTSLPGINKNALGSFTAAGIVLSYALWMRVHWTRAGVWLTFAGLIDLAATIVTSSRGAMLGAGVAVLLIGLMLQTHRPSRKFIAALIAIALVVLYAVVVAPERAASTRNPGAYDSSTVRSISWSFAVKQIEHDPWIGTGARTYYEPLFGGALLDPNNLFLLTWCELGIPGMLALCWLLYSFGQLLVRARKLAPDIAPLALGLGGVALSLLVHFQVDVSWSRGETTLEFAMIGLLLACLRLAERPSTVAAEPGRPAADAMLSQAASTQQLVHT